MTARMLQLTLLCCALACDVQQDLGEVGASDADASSAQCGDDPGLPQESFIVDGAAVIEVPASGVDAAGAPIGSCVSGTAGTGGTLDAGDGDGDGALAEDLAAVPDSFSCPADEPWLCLSEVETLHRFVGSGTEKSKTHLAFDAEGNEYIGYDGESRDVIASYTREGRPRWTHPLGRGTTNFELGGGRLCTAANTNAFYGEVAIRFRDRSPEPAYVGGAVACYDTLGRELWWRYLDAGAGYANVEDLAIDAAGNVYVAGHIDFDGDAESAASEAFIQQLLANGDAGWLHVMRGDGRDFAARIEAGEQGIWVMGVVSARTELAGGVLEHNPIVAGDSVWLASLTFAGEVTTAAVVPPPDINAGGFDHGALWAEDGGAVAAIRWWGGFQHVVRADAAGAIDSTTLEGFSYLESIAGVVRYGEGYVVGGSCRDERDVSDVCLVRLDDRLREVTAGRYGRPYAHGDAGKVDALESLAVSPSGQLYIGGRSSERRDVDPSDPFVATVAPREPEPTP
jgi:hypothetical protein